MLFTENAGQLSDEVVFYSMHPSVVYVLKDGTVHINGVRVSFGSEPRFITADMPLRTKISYFGQNKAISNIPTYRRVVLKEVYPKVDAILTADGRGVVEFQFIVRPGGDPSRIKVETDGRVVQREDGIYIVKEGIELVRISDLKAYQGAEEINVKAEVKGKGVRFIVKSWDRKHTLVIDPIATAIVASNYYDAAYSVAIDGSGNVFIAGYTTGSSSLAPSRNVFGVSGGWDAFVTKLSNDLTAHISTAILASSDGDVARSVAVDGSGNVFVAGWTWDSGNFAPSRNVFGTSGGLDAFVSKLNNDLSQHLATAILTSSGTDMAYSVAVDASGNVFVAGRSSNSGNFATNRNVFGTSGGTDAFVSKLTNDLSQHLSAAILTSDREDVAYTVTVDGSGNVFVAGYTLGSGNFAPSRNVFGTSGTVDAFVSKLNNDLTSHISTAILASSSSDEIFDVVVDASGNVFVAGWTNNSSDFAPSRNVFGSTTGVSGDRDAFVSKLSGDLSAHMATAILAAIGDDEAYSVDVSGSGGVFVSGYTTNSSGFATNRMVFGTPSSPNDTAAFVSLLNNSLSRHVAVAILTSSRNDYANAVVVDGSGNVFVAGETFKYSNFAQNRNVFGSPGYLYSDAFVSKLTGILSVSERPRTVNGVGVNLSKGVLILTLPTSAYVGFDLYSPNGRLIKRVSLGYLPTGKYEYRLKLPKGVYLLKVRVGDEVREIKGVM